MISLAHRSAVSGLVLVVMGGGHLGSAAEVASPDERVRATVSVVDGSLRYRVSLDGETLLEDSPLGLVTSAGDLSRGLTLDGETDVTSVRDEYSLPIGKKSRATYLANRRVTTVRSASGQRMSVVVQVSDDGVALAYRLHGDPGAEVVVERELTGFALPEGSHGFLHPMHVARSGWMRTNPSYEAHYSIDQPVGVPSSDGQGWCFPALFRVGDEGWVLISETGVDGGYTGTHLAHESAGGVYRLAFPQRDENLPTDPIAPTVAGDAQTPWRILIVGRTLAPIVESTLATDLVRPLFESDGVFPPGRSAWSWVFLKDGETVYETQREFIDMAAELGWEYVLIDSMWDQQIGRDRIAELVDYAAGKNVGVWLWYNSNGPWNDAPQTPKNRMYDRDVRAREMEWLREIGVKGLKVDFFGGDKQSGMRFYDGLLRDAARYGLSLNFHGTTLPRGWERMYPNFVTNEAVMGMEFVTFEQRNADLEAQHASVLPYVRNVVGPMDFTPVILSVPLGLQPDPPQRRTTDAFELTLPVLFFSGVQHFGITPAQLAAQPEYVKAYLSRLPATWDETRHVDGYPGRFAVLARRSGETWYVAAINGEAQEKEVAIPSALLDEIGGPGPWTILADGQDGVEQRPLSAPAGEPLTFSLPPNGGAVLWTE
jgi:Glycoside hydrolase 97/Glycosyl-hydrolase 97 N-terminal/Glycosyl-hydrolase 97 C-terminal, oligomerisation